VEQRQRQVPGVVLAARSAALLSRSFGHQGTAPTIRYRSRSPVTWRRCRPTRLISPQTIKLYDIRVKAGAQGSSAVPTISSGSTHVTPPPPPPSSSTSSSPRIFRSQSLPCAQCSRAGSPAAATTASSKFGTWPCLPSPSSPLPQLQRPLQTSHFTLNAEVRLLHPTFLYCKLFLNALLGLLFASLRAEQRVEVFDFSLAPMPGSEHVPVTPWRSYELPEEVCRLVTVLFHLLCSISRTRRGTHSHLSPFRLQRHAGNPCPMSLLRAFYFP
jgi:hypothetical protein